MKFLGLDIGSTATKGILIDEHGRVNKRVIRSSTPNMQAAAGLVNDEIGVGDAFVVTTGYGRELFTKRSDTVSEITALGMGINAVFPGVRTVVDIGGQDSKVAILNNGRVMDFTMNDRCAAGTGRFLEVMSRVLDVPMSDFDGVAASTTEAQHITSTCTVFAESEVVGLLSRNVEIPKILRGLMASIADRVAALAGQLSLAEPVAATGGTMRSRAVVEALSGALGVNVVVVPHPQTVTALGAALVGMKRAGKAIPTVDWT